jgi:hypothetical protein
MPHGIKFVLKVHVTDLRGVFLAYCNFFASLKSTTKKSIEKVQHAATIGWTFFLYASSMVERARRRAVERKFFLLVSAARAGPSSAAMRAPGEPDRFELCPDF